MVYMYDGVPGSGKSLHVAKEIYKALRNGKNVISTIKFRDDLVKPKKGREKGKFIYVSKEELLFNSFYRMKGTKERYERKEPLKEMGFSYILGLEGFARNFHARNSDGSIKEHQTLLCIDECQDFFNTRTWNRADRLSWCSFFRMHRHLGYDCILSSQDDKVVDKQIRAVLQRRVLHRNVKDLKVIGFFLWVIAGMDLFCASESIYSIRGKAGHVRTVYFKGRKYYGFYCSTAYTFADVV